MNNNTSIFISWTNLWFILLWLSLWWPERLVLYPYMHKTGLCRRWHSRHFTILLTNRARKWRWVKWLCGQLTKGWQRPNRLCCRVWIWAFKAVIRAMPSCCREVFRLMEQLTTSYRVWELFPLQTASKTHLIGKTVLRLRLHKWSMPVELSVRASVWRNWARKWQNSMWRRTARKCASCWRVTILTSVS